MPLIEPQLADVQPRVRIQVLRASETLYKRGDTSLAVAYRRLAKESDPDVAIQAIRTMNTLRVSDAATTVRDAIASNPTRGVKLIGEQILTAPAELGVRGLAGRSFTPEQRAMLERGATTFNETCSQCHGETGLGKLLGNGQQIARAGRAACRNNPACGSSSSCRSQSRLPSCNSNSVARPGGVGYRALRRLQPEHHRSWFRVRSASRCLRRR